MKHCRTIAGLFFVLLMHSLSELAAQSGSFHNIEIPTPAFQKQEGFTNYNDLVEFLEQEINDKRSIARLEWIGESRLGKRIPAIHIDDGSGDDKIRIWFQGGLHGNEPAGTEGLLMYLHYLLNNDDAGSLLKEVSIMIVPMANIDGYEKQSRFSASGADLNRDQTRLLEPETVSLKNALNSFSPHVAIDIHEYQPTRPELAKITGNTLTVPYDVLFLPSGNLNIPGDLRSIVHELYLSEVSSLLELYDLSSHYYFLPKTTKDGSIYLKMGGSSPRSSATSFGLTNAVSIIFEIRGIGLGRKNFERRVFSGFLFSKSIVETTYNNKQRVLESVDNAIRATISLQKDIVLNAKPGVYMDEIQFLDLDENKIIQKSMMIKDANRSEPTQIRRRPRGYVLLPECSSLAGKLKILGLTIDTLKNERRLKVESYMVTDTAGLDPIDKFAVNSVTIRLEKSRILFPAGSYFISTEQKNAGLAVSTLEPEMANGFVRYGVFDARTGDELPFYRLLKKTKFSFTKQ